MKVKTVIVAVFLMGAVVTARAYGIDAPRPPALYGAGPLKAPYASPSLFKSEKAAFAGLEGAMQEAEAVIYQGGCMAAIGKNGWQWDISASVDQFGAGTIGVSANGGPQFFLEVSEVIPPPTPSYLGGSHFKVTGYRTNVFVGRKIPYYWAHAYYNKTGQMMTLNANFHVQNVNNNLDHLSSNVIKDFYKLAPKPLPGQRNAPTIYDWGLQSLSKNSVPQDKWWQRSLVNRSDGLEAVTIIEKDRLFPIRKTCL